MPIELERRQLELDSIERELCGSITPQELTRNASFTNVNIKCSEPATLPKPEESLDSIRNDFEKTDLKRSISSLGQDKSRQEDSQQAPVVEIVDQSLRFAGTADVEVDYACSSQRNSNVPQVKPSVKRSNTSTKEKKVMSSGHSSQKRLNELMAVKRERQMTAFELDSQKRRQKVSSAATPTDK